MAVRHAITSNPYFPKPAELRASIVDELSDYRRRHDEARRRALAAPPDPPPKSEEDFVYVDNLVADALKGIAGKRAIIQGRKAQEWDGSGMLYLPEDDPRRLVWSTCESPIEQYLCCGIFSFLGCKAVSGAFDEARLSQLAEAAGDRPTCFLFSQHPIGNYRADFLLVVVDPQRRISRRLVVECDGKEYHGSEQQIARDKRRDEEIGEAGYKVIRYSGSAVYGEMREVIDEIKRWIEGAGAVCEPDGFASFLDKFTPSRAQRHQRQQERADYWREEQAAARTEEPDFITDHHTAGRWRDTI